jgi:hypothetical protein
VFAFRPGETLRRLCQEIVSFAHAPIIPCPAGGM